MNIVNRIQKQCRLAQTYAEEGALHSAGAILTELASEVRQLAMSADQFLAAMADDDEVINPYGSGPVPIEPREG